MQPGGVGAALHAARPRLTHREGLSPESNNWPDAAWPRQRAFWKRAPLAASKPFDRLAAATRARRRVGPRPVARCAVRRPRDTRAAQVCRANRRGAARRGAAVALPRAAQSHCAHRPGATLLRRGVLAAGEPWTAGLQTAARRGQPWRAASARGGAPHRHMHMHMHVHMHMHMHVPMRWLELPTYLAGPHPLLLRGAAHACAPPSVARGSST